MPRRFSSPFSNTRRLSVAPAGLLEQPAGPARLSDALLAKLTEDDPSPELKAEHTRLVDPLMDGLTSCAWQLKDVGGNKDKLTVRFNQDWDKRVASLTEKQELSQTHIEQLSSRTDKLVKVTELQGERIDSVARGSEKINLLIAGDKDVGVKGIREIFASKSHVYKTCVGFLFTAVIVTTFFFSWQYKLMKDAIDEHDMIPVHDGAMPKEVFAVTQQIKPDIYPKVDDEATIILIYDKSQTIIQASWNWNYNRKDIEIYGKSGYIHCSNRSDMQIMRSEKEGAQSLTVPGPSEPNNDPFTYFMAVIREEVEVKLTDLSSLKNNITVMAILQAAKASAEQGKKISLNSPD